MQILAKTQNGKTITLEGEPRDTTEKEESTLHLVLGQRGATIEPSVCQLAQKYSCDKMICPKCYTCLHPPRLSTAARGKVATPTTCPKKKVEEVLLHHNLGQQGGFCLNPVALGHQ
ncbi:ubiquitin-ribosomal protein eL40 fusion protein-like [Desmodus rotundus]|uniref:ubiquitin-ribosomal protein eL40 fusion protein-like n=1 Tax=Desmodus rotundus TaxID=9430 RepID=UPI0039E57981